ncbi:glycosyltransferase [Ruania suaedae]|uniref:glycosyltransferase n=1 Tax=Ruania suaedae TaxID=2897774 RepID=UPI001E6551EB|nr:glycosyltransferase [Ruania suaedae]UFU02388.1 glycosyltransferase [Ruania suaedae]
MSHRADVVMITYRSAGYLHLSLPRLLETLGEHDRVWLWHNGDDEATIEALRPFVADARVHRYHHSRENVKLREPTSWLWRDSSARFVSKVDDDCLVAPGWLDTFTEAHDANPQFGVIGSWRHPPEDFRPELAARKIETFAGGHRLMRNLWVQGSGYLMPRALVDRHGTIGPEETFTDYCIRTARTGSVNGFYYPFVPEDHMDDPRSPHTLIRTDADLSARMPLSAAANGVSTVTEWTEQLRRSAAILQTASLDPRSYAGWRAKVRAGRRRLALLRGRPARW